MPHSRPHLGDRQRSADSYQSKPLMRRLPKTTDSQTSQNLDAGSIRDPRVAPRLVGVYGVCLRRSLQRMPWIRGRLGGDRKKILASAFAGPKTPLWRRFYGVVCGLSLSRLDRVCVDTSPTDQMTYF